MRRGFFETSHVGVPTWCMNTCNVKWGVRLLIGNYTHAAWPYIALARARYLRVDRRRVADIPYRKFRMVTTTVCEV